MDSETPESPERRSSLRAHVEDRMPAFVATLTGGAVAMGVNAPLTSPDDLIANAGSVSVVGIIAAFIAGMIWARISGDIQARSKRFNIVLTVILLLIVAAAAAIEYAGDISNAIRYIIPLAAVVTIFCSVLTPTFERWKTNPAFLWIALLLPIVMLTVGYWLTSNEFGFTEAPSLSLPPPPA